MSVAMMGVGTLISAGAARKTQRNLRDIARTPGLDIGEQYSEIEGLLPQMQGLETQRNSFNMDELSRILNESIPGYDDAQQQRMDTVGSLQRGEIPQDVQDAIFRRGASQGVAGGYGPGSGMGRSLVARDLGRTSLDLIGAGNQMFQQTIDGTPRVDQANLAMDPLQMIQLRSGERLQKMQARMTAEMSPSGSAVMGQGMQQMGASLMEMAGSVGGMAASAGVAACFIARLCIPEAWERFYVWKELLAPREFRDWYNQNAERVALWLADKPEKIKQIRAWMLHILKESPCHY